MLPNELGFIKDCAYAFDERIIPSFVYYKFRECLEEQKNSVPPPKLNTNGTIAQKTLSNEMLLLEL